MEKGNGNAPVKEYSCRLELPTNRTILQLSGNNLEVMKDQIQRFMGGGCHFEPYGNSTLVLHPSIGAGKKGVGWISPPVELPTYLSTTGLIEARHFEQAAA